MTKPLALVVYENLLPGSQLSNRLHDLGYRVMTLPETEDLLDQTQKAMPLIVLLDMAMPKIDLCAFIQRMKLNPGTSHIPIIAFAGSQNGELLSRAQEAGAALVASDEAMITQLPHLLEQALRLD